MPNKSPEKLPENRSGAERRWPPLDAMKERIARLDHAPDRNAEAFKREVEAVRVDAEFLDEDLYEHLADVVERDPRIAKFMRERNLPQWHAIDHEKEQMMA